MNANDMLDYALGQLDGPAREQVERALVSDPEAALRAGRLTRAVRRLVDDGATFEPPDGLADRTAAFVAEAVQKRRTILDFVPATVPFRWADVAVAAGIFLAGLMTLLPAVQKSRERMEQAGCGYNLQQLGRALWQYGIRHHHYPFGPDQDPEALTGSFVAQLHDTGLLTDADLASLDCPCNGSSRAKHPLPDFKTLSRLARTDPDRARQAICSSYAYNVGHQHPSGRGVVPVAAVISATVPLLADQPPHADAEFRSLRPGNSPNHGGRGQNVLYSDLHVGWHNTRRIGPKDDDLFLNARQQIAPGLSPDDTALLPSMVPCLGW
jgi:hypothetical protein